MLLSSKKYREWHIDASLQLLTAPKYKIEKASVTLKFFAPDKRVSDLSNKTESVMDLLVDNNVLSDDNWFVCGDIHMIFGGVDVKNPRVEITIQ